MLVGELIEDEEIWGEAVGKGRVAMCGVLPAQQAGTQESQVGKTITE
jgi:hypothetical protein